MKNILKALLLVTSQLLAACLMAQSVEVGYVKEYQGEEQKTPLSGVELRVAGAPSTISDAKGRYELRFSVLKPGEQVKYDDIYKSGYVVFNTDALDYWRISKDQSPFVIVMCKESVFRQLKLKYYNIIGKSYEEDYNRRLENAKLKYAIDTLRLSEEIKTIKNDYNEKLRNIDNYAELFARIDHSEMDSIEAKALRLIDEGKIDEGIAKYEELHLVEQTRMQLDKWRSGKNMVTVGGKMMEESEQELLPLVEKLKKQIALYEMGGLSYDSKQVEMILHLVDVYDELNEMMDGKFHEEAGQWLVKLADNAKDLDSMEQLLRRAANVPSATGLYQLINWYEMLIYRNCHYLDSTKLFINKALQLTWNDSVREKFENLQYWISDFGEQISNRDTLYFKYVNEQSENVAVWMKAKYYSNRFDGTIRIPESVLHDGQLYRVTIIGSASFYNNRYLKKVIVSEGITHIYPQAFDRCQALDTIVLSKSVQYIGDDAIPYNTKIIMPQDLSNALWLENVVPSMIDSMYNDSSLLFKYDDLWEMLNSAKKNKTTNESIRPYLDYWLGQMCWLKNDIVGAILHYQEASKFDLWGKELYYTIGGLYNLQKNHKKAYQYYMKTADDNHPWVYNALAYMYARGEYVKQSFDNAMKYIDMAIQHAPNNEQLANYYDSKGEISLMMGEIDKAKEYWNKVLEVYPDFNVETSDLYYKLYKLRENDFETTIENESNDTITESSHIYLTKEQLQKYVDVVRLVAYAEYSRLYYSNASLFFVDYDELVSIGIIAVQVIINDKTPEQLERYNIFYVATAVRWAIRNEMRIRYQWYKLHNMDTYRGEEGMFDEMDSNKQKMDVVVSIYNTIYEMYGQLDSDDYGGIEKEISEMWELINEAIDNLPPKAKNIARDRIVLGLSLPEIEERSQGLSHDRIERLWTSSLIAIGEYLQSHEVYGLSFHPTGSSDTTFNREQLQHYVDIVRIVTLAEYGMMDYTGDSLHFVDIEELVSIGILAVQVLINNKTPEQLEKYNDFYVATAVRWAIRNELGIRYKWYKDLVESDDEELFDETNPEIQRSRVSVNIYNTIYVVFRQIEKEKINNKKSLNEIETEFVSRWKLIEDGRKTLSEKEQIIATNMIVEGFTIEKTMQINGVTIEECASVIEKIRQYLKDKSAIK